jgi:hypothetical protein
LVAKVKEKTMVCKKCGEKIEPKLNFCTKCGTKISGPGRMFLRGTGIFFIISASLGIISLFSLPKTVELSASLGVKVNVPLALITGGIGAILYLVIGISGIKFSQNIQKAKLLKHFALILIVFQLVSSIISFIVNKPPLTISFILGLALGLICPILYWIGANKNLQSKEGE